MNLAILSRSKDCYSTSRLVDATKARGHEVRVFDTCLLYTSPSPRDQRGSRMPSSA